MMEAQNILAELRETTLTDEEIRLRCLEYATRNGSFIDPLQIAKEMYAWVKENSDKGND